MSKKEDQYAQIIVRHMANLFDDEDGECYIDVNELAEGDNATHFIHALANIAPSIICTKITGEHKNLLEFNHMANQLVFQYLRKE